jgi:hypothetical protein
MNVTQDINGIKIRSIMKKWNNVFGKYIIYNPEEFLLNNPIGDKVNA